MSEAPIRRFGRYEVERPLGDGAMGEVYQARDHALGRDVAIKVMRPTPGVAASLFRARFDAEARALAALRHPAVVAVYDLGWEGDAPYLVMELVPGGSLRDRLATGPLAAAEVTRLAIAIGGALGAAHAAGILHRDVKPANILGGPGGWKLADFGIAHVPGSELTLTGQFLGTPAYAAPEALAEGLHTPAADVWGLGATMYAAVTGVPPYGGSLGAAATTSYVPVRERAPEVPAPLAGMIEAALDRDPARRPTAAALCEQLELAPASSASFAPATSTSTSIEPAARSGTVHAARPPWLWPAIGGAAILAIGLVALLATSGGGGGAPRGAPPGPSRALPAAEGDRAMVTVQGDGSIAIDRAQLDAPRADDAAHRLDDAIRKAEDGKLDEAIDHLDDLLDHGPDDPQVAVLRASLAELRDQGAGDRRGPPGPGGPPGKKKHKHDD